MEKENKSAGNINRMKKKMLTNKAGVSVATNATLKSIQTLKQGN